MFGVLDAYASRMGMLFALAEKQQPAGEAGGLQPDQ
jgi:hypothetical protein